MVVCRYICLVLADLHFVPCVFVSMRSTRTPALLPLLHLRQCHLQSGSPPMLTLRSWSSNASYMIFSRKMLKRVGEKRHPFRTSTVVLNHSPVLPLNKTALWALSYRLSITRMMLALMLYFLIVAHKTSCHTLLKAFLKSMKSW